MEGFDFDDNTMKLNKASSFPARIFSGGVGEIKKLFRIAEIFIVLVLLTWTLPRVPFAVRISGEYFRRLVSIVVSHLFVFLLSNAIVLTLFFKSRSLFLHSREIHVDFCQEFIADGAYFAGESCRRAEEIVCQDKRTILEVTKVRVHRRSQSANFRREKSLEKERGGCGRQLRRSETEVQRKAAAAAEVVDELSNEEFQRAIEAFIAKQIKFHQQEKFTIVLHECN